MVSFALLAYGGEIMIIRKKKESSFPVWQLKDELQKRRIPINRFAEALGIRPGAIHGNRPFPDEKTDECWKLLANWESKAQAQS